jgi:hypothetical protein
MKHWARCLSRRTEKGKTYGEVTAKALAVLEALLWAFHNARSGLCFPSYEAVAEAAHCARSTVAEAIRALEDAGILTWVQRIKRVREAAPDLFDGHGWRWRVIRTSNAYNFRDPSPAADRPSSSKSERPTGTPNQAFFSSLPCPLWPSRGTNSEGAAAVTARRASERLGQPPRLVSNLRWEKKGTGGTKAASGLPMASYSFHAGLRWKPCLKKGPLRVIEALRNIGRSTEARSHTLISIATHSSGSNGSIHMCSPTNSEGQPWDAGDAANAESSTGRRSSTSTGAR